jgi:hypothetical protein
MYARSTRRSLDWSLALLRWIGFWSAIVLPALHVSLLVAEGVTPATAPTLVALWATNAVAVALGRGHTPLSTGAYDG